MKAHNPKWNTQFSVRIFDDYNLKVKLIDRHLKAIIGE